MAKANTGGYNLSFYSTTMTGMAGSSKEENTGGSVYAINGSKTENTADGTITISYKNRLSDGTDETDSNGNVKIYKKTYYRYNTEIGQRAKWKIIMPINICMEMLLIFLTLIFLFFICGGNFYYGTAAGVFAFGDGSGNAKDQCGFLAVAI